MPNLSKPAPLPNPPTAPGNMPRLRNAARTLKILTTLIVLTLVCTYARTAFRDASPHPQTTASLSHPAAQPFFAPTPTRARAPRRRPAIFRQVHQINHHTRRSNPYYLASLRRIRRLFSQLLVVRS